MNTARVARFPGQAVVPHPALFLYPGSRSALRALQLQRRGASFGQWNGNQSTEAGHANRDFRGALKHAEVMALKVLRTAEQKLEKAKVGLQRASDVDRLDPA